MSKFENASSLRANSNVRGISGTCPRCKTGNMYKETANEYVCLQCGYRDFPRISEVLQFCKDGRHTILEGDDDSY